MHFMVVTFRQIERGEKPTKEQVAGATATSYAIGRGLSVPSKKVIDEEIDRAELLMPRFDFIGCVEADSESAAIRAVIDLRYSGSIHKDDRFAAIPLKLYSSECDVVEVSDV